MRTRMYFSSPVVIAISTLLLVALWCTETFLIQRNDRSGNIWPVCTVTTPGSLLSYLTRSSCKAIDKDYVFIGAEDSKIEYLGRWTQTKQGSRSDAAFPGSSLRFVIRNATSIILALQNSRRSISHDKKRNKVSTSTSVSFLSPISPIGCAGPVSLLLQIDDDPTKTFFLDRSAHGYIQIPLNQRHEDESETVTVTFLGGESAKSTMHFLGLWILKGGFVVPASSVHGSRRAIEMVGSTLPATLQLESQRGQILQHSMFPQTSITHIPVPDGVGILSTPKHERWRPNLQHLFFRSGPMENRFFQRPWLFREDRNVPDVLLLNIGWNDFRRFFHDQPHPDRRAIDRFIDAFVEAYLAYLQIIRRSAYPLNPFDSSPAGPLDKSYVYHSAPSLVPIFIVLPPVTPASRYRNMISLLHIALNRVVRDAQKEYGDKSTFLVDTSGWLEDDDIDGDRKTDPIMEHGAHINLRGQQKILKYLALHLCPFLDVASTRTNPLDCPFRPPQHYVGELFVPEDFDFSLMIDRKKTGSLKSLFDLQTKS